MTIPPFPSQDLAKLVLGYLAEEQLMTAYDEFLQASPYLDVLRNEYDRIFMTSLKNILAEYRAVKIYVETCKPFLLRKKLFQCSNLLEVIKFLVNHIDVNRLQAQDASIEKLRHKLLNRIQKFFHHWKAAPLMSNSYNKQTLYSKSNVCEVCHSLSLDTCVCKATTGRSVPNTHSNVQVEAKRAENSIETTSLSDLPGNSTKKRNSTKEVTAEINSECSPSEGIMNMTSRGHNVQSSTSCKPQVLSNTQNSVNLTVNTKDISLVQSDQSKEKIEEFNNILNLVCSDNKSINPPRRNNFDNGSNINRLSNMNSCQELTNTGHSDKEKPIVPDSSTSENFNAQIIASNENRTNLTPITNIKGPPLAQFLLKAGTINNPYFQKNKDFSNMLKSDSSVKIKEKFDDQKVTILSDVKVDDAFKNNRNKIPTTSSPVVQMQTIVINGTPAYKYKQQTATNFTKDEIMAMPTIILVPTSGSSQNLPATYSQSNISHSTNAITTNINSIPRVLSPLVIDVPSDNPHSLPDSNDLPEIIIEDCNKVNSAGLVKTVDVPAHGSLPKDTNVTVPNKTSTPNTLPTTRKSSSTPRRNSHVRVLDFATPRRILHETVKELAPPQTSSEIIDVGSEIITISNPDIPAHKCIVTTNNRYDKTDYIGEAKSTSKKSKSKSVKTSNWDAELRALALGTTVSEEKKADPKPRCKKKKKKVTITTENVSDNLQTNNIKSSDIKESKTNKSKKKQKVIERVEEPVKEEDKQKKELINIVTECDVHAYELESTESQTKIHTSNEQVDTPENERLSLQNVIGAKLNISDLLETPYKQALYDIQMETPKFLGPDLPDDPISDVKIMSIPTPRFFNTPMALQATPSYSSRLTDYSSGGSYYKPDDDHDYIPPSEVLHCKVTAMENMTKSETKEPILENKEKEKSDKPIRPQRRCARNVSYKGSVICKAKDNDILENVSVSSETSNKSIKNKKNNKTADSKAQSSLKHKSDNKKKIKAYKSPQKPKNFMKIKPRRPTPVKESSKNRKKTSDLSGNLIKSSKKGVTSKDKDNVRLIETVPPTKSRRKSSTPRKLNCVKPMSENSSDLSKSIRDVAPMADTSHDREDDSQKQSCMSSNRIQDSNFKEQHPTSSSPDEDDITKIKEYIETSAQSNNVPDNNNEGSLHIDLIKRGFDVETAKIIERDLLDTTPIQDTAIQSTSNEEINVRKLEVFVTVSDRESDSSIVNNLQIVQDEVEELELSVHECNEMTDNFVSCQFDESNSLPNNPISKLKEKFSIELCIDDGVTVRLRALPFKSLFDMEPEEITIQNSDKETEDAVSSISNIDKLYTPIKDHRQECYEIFDSTLTSIDTPLKKDVTVISSCETNVSEIVLEVESIDVKEKLETKKRKRLQSGNLEDSLNKKSKPDTQYLLNSANIQNIDIESVLSKLHGP